ncbi:RidA family protein [Spirosoma litoris]
MMKYLRSLFLLAILTSCSKDEPVATVKVPSGYLYKVEPAISGKTAYICGERPFNDTGALVGGTDLGAQTRQVFDNVKTSLATVGMSLTDVAQVTYSIKEASGVTQVSASKLETVKAVEATYFAKTPSIVTAKAVSQTTREDVLIEVEVIAIK